METSLVLNRTLNDVVFEGRNQTYGAYHLRRLYDRNMSKAMVSGIVFFLLAFSSPNLIRIINGNSEEQKSDLIESLISLTDPPPIDRVKPEPPKPPAIKPPPIKSHIKYVSPFVESDKKVSDENEQLPPPDSVLDSNVISSKSVPGDPKGKDPSLDNPKTTDPVFIRDSVSTEKPFTWVKQMPSFPDGEKAMYEYIYKHISYPKLAREINISGKVVVQFVISKEGDIQDVNVVSGIGGGCNEEAMRVISGMPRWKPGKHNGEPVPVTLSIPIRFELR